MKIFLLDLLKKWTTKIDFNPFLISTEGFETIEEKSIELKKMLVYSDCGIGAEYANEILKVMILGAALIITTNYFLAKENIK